MSDHREAAIEAFMSIKPRGFFGEPLNGGATREVAEKFVDAVAAHVLELMTKTLEESE